jgi:hypothetical protein
MTVDIRRWLGGTAVALAAGSLLIAPQAASAAGHSLPPVAAKFDYQIGAAYTPPAGVTVVSRDRGAAPAAGLYNICYVNAFQTQPEETAWWKVNHDSLLLKDKGGRYVVDGEWNEVLLDTSTDAKRAALAGIVGGWIAGCAKSGFNAIEPDNIDSYQRSKKLLTDAHAVSYLGLLATRAHQAGLAIAQKNALELKDRGRKAGLDFAIAEECGQYQECADYQAQYGNNVIAIEYRAGGLTTACKSLAGKTSVVRRDVDVTAPGSKTYIYKTC